MRGVQKAAAWLCIMQKRLFKKVSFLFVLCMVPLLVFGMRVGAGQEKGVVTVALCQADPGDGLAREIIGALVDSRSVMRFAVCSEEEARARVRDGTADAAWIFCAGVHEALARAGAKGRVRPVVTVVEREDDALLAFTREVLYGRLFAYFSYEAYCGYMRTRAGLPQLTDAELREAYDSCLKGGSLFRLETLGGEEVRPMDYLLSPLRGLLALWFMLGGLAASLYYLHDESRGLLARTPLYRRPLYALGLGGIMGLDGAAVMLLALKAGGLFTGPGRELPAMALLLLSTLFFCALARVLCGTMRWLGGLAPLLLICMAVFCPVFVDLHSFRAVQYVFPPFWYLNAVSNPRYLMPMAAYAAVLAALYAGAAGVLPRFRRGGAPS